MKRHTTQHELVEKLKRIGCILPLLLMPTLAPAQFVYETNEGTITITGYMGPGGAVFIPPTIGGLPVARIGTLAFDNWTSLTSVTIPDSVTSIGWSAFHSCAGLVFVSIGNGVTNIEDYAFSGCISLTAIPVAPLNPSYSSLDGVLFDKTAKTLIRYPEAKIGGYAIPLSVTSIGNSAFADSASLSSVTIPDSVTSIAAFAFDWCSSLGSVTIPDSVTEFGAAVFHGCTSLTNAVIGNGVTSLEYTDELTAAYEHWGAFEDCTSLTSVKIGDRVANIGEFAFQGCSSLSRITIPDSVIRIGGGAFEQCTSLTNVTMGTRITAIESVVVSMQGMFQPMACFGAFSGCTNLTRITIPDSVTRLGAGAFYACTSLTNATIGNSVVSIDTAAVGDSMSGYHLRGAFGRCTSLTSVTIGQSVTNIAGEAFYGCSALRNVYFQGNSPAVGSNVFSGVAFATAYYLPGTIGWAPSFGDRPTALWHLPHPVILDFPPVFGGKPFFGFRTSWATNSSVVVDACANFASPVWVPVATNTLTDGWVDFADLETANYPTRFYRVRSP